MMRQYEADAKELVRSLSVLTGIDTDYLNSIVHNKSFNSLFFDGPPAGLTKTQVRKLELLKEFRVAYEMETTHQNGINLGSTNKSGSYFSDYFRLEDNRQHLCAAYLNSSNSLITVRKFEKDDLNYLLINKKQFVQDVLDHNAFSIILSRYCPVDHYKEYNGDIDGDIEAISQLGTVMKGIGAHIIDYTVVNQDGGYFSFAERDYMPEINTGQIQLAESKHPYNQEVSNSADAARRPYEPDPASNREKLVAAVSGLSGVKPAKLDQYLKENPAKNIFEVNQRELTDRQHKKLSILKKIKNSLPNILENENKDDYILNSVQKASEYFKNYFSNIVDKEYFLTAFLDKHDRVIKTQICSEGTINESPAYPREIVKSVLKNKAVSVIFAHNHPGGSIVISQADTNLTFKIAGVLKSIGVDVKDHIIVAGKRTVSIRESDSSIFQDNDTTAKNRAYAMEASQDIEDANLTRPARPSLRECMEAAKTASLEQNKKPSRQAKYQQAR